MGTCALNVPPGYRGCYATDPPPAKEPEKEVPSVVQEGTLTPINNIQSTPAEEPYSIYTRKQKWFIVGIVAVAGFHSPLPANIYFPAIPMMAEAFGTSEEVINQTVTAYLVMQGICAGVTGDIATPEERGSYFGLFNLGPMLAPCIGPAIGGALAENLGWRSIFWALVIMAGCCWIMLYISFLPETLRTLAGNGSIPQTGIHRPLITVVGRGKQAAIPATLPLSTKKQSINPFILFTYPDVVIALLFTGVIYSVNYSIMATISSAFSDVYPWLSETLLGICYLPTGLGMIVGTQVTGRLLDHEYAKIKKSHVEGPFPKEYARLRTMPYHLIVFVMAVVGWGLSLGLSAHVAVPLVISVVLGWCGMAVLNTTMTLMIDILQSRSSGATACTNFVRCSLGAIVVATTDRMVTNLGYIWTYVMLAAICACMLPVMYIQMKIGPKWRLQRDKLDM
ncbi:hypothetical protein G7054_g383 [Neopestalotiopsis clavispora]|nr:hypothetical protein G7054_g383 [Neopestalotiopsis clavispora]